MSAKENFLSWRLFANRISDKEHKRTAGVESDFIIKIDYTIFCVLRFCVVLHPSNYKFNFSNFHFFDLDVKW